MAVSIEDAIARVRETLGEQNWLLLDATEQTRAIYREIRRLDLEETMNRRALARAAANGAAANGAPAGPPCVPVSLTCEPPPVPAPPRCSAFIKTRAGQRCGWNPVMTFEGQLYCGFHNPQRRMGRHRMLEAVNANARPPVTPSAGASVAPPLAAATAR